MIIDHLFTRPLFESQMDPITQFASNAHEEWRRNFDPTGTKPRIKKNSDGTEGDINVPFADLHPDWQKENLAAGHAAHRAVKHFGHDMEKAAEYVHSAWMKRNPKGDWNAAQHVPYDDLPEDEKEKDRVHVRTMMKLMGHHHKQGVEEVAPPGAKAERMVKHIKAGYAKDGKLTPKEKGIAYATAWKAHNAGRVEEQGVAEGKDDKIAQLKQDYATAVHWSKNEKSPQKREAARQKAEKIKAHLEKQYKQGVAEGEKKPHPETWHDVDKKLGRAVDKMSQAEKVKKGLAHPDTLKKKGVAEGKKKSDTYHIVNKDGKPASLASYADKESAVKDRDAKHQGAEVRQLGPRGKVKSVAEGQLDELSTSRLAQYKTAAAADAKQADQAGDVKRGDKRFSGIVKATKKQFDNDAKKIDESRRARQALMARIANSR